MCLTLQMEIVFFYAWTIFSCLVFNPTPAVMMAIRCRAVFAPHKGCTPAVVTCYDSFCFCLQCIPAVVIRQCTVSNLGIRSVGFGAGIANDSSMTVTWVPSFECCQALCMNVDHYQREMGLEPHVSCVPGKATTFILSYTAN